jgi:hypothetical protein
MLLERKNMCEDYEICLTSEDVLDEISYGENNYPVAAFCCADRFGDALKLWAKGYRCFHEEENAEEFWRICCSFVKNINGFTSDKKFLEFMMTEVLNSYQQLNLKERKVLVDALDISMLNKKMITRLRSDFQQVYRDIVALRLGIHAEDLVRCGDAQFVEDYMERLAWRNKLIAFKLRCHLQQNLPETLLNGATKQVSKNGLKDYMDSLRKLYSYCKEEFPKDYLCDVAVVETIMRMRMIVANTEQCPDRQQLEKMVSTSGVIQKLYSSFDKQLQEHLQEEYALDCPVSVMIMSCLPPCDSSDSYDWLNCVQEGDYLILEHLLDFGHEKFANMKFVISESTLDFVSRKWEEEQIEEGNHQIFTTYEDTKERVEEFAEWVRAHCQVI